MFKRLLSDVQIDLRIVTTGPLLIKSGRGVQGDSTARALRTSADGDQHPVIPGSSLKGTLRSHAEQVLRTLTPESAPACCNPFERSRASVNCSCSERLRPANQTNPPPADRAYHDACPACRLFGFLYCAGRLGIDDAIVQNRAPGYQAAGRLPIRGRYQVEVRDGVGIDRWTGGAAIGPKFAMEAVTNAVFEARLRLENVELWQLGLVGLALGDLQEGRIRLGSAKTRGFGAVRGEVLGVQFAYVRPAQADKIRGVGELVDAAERTRYGFSHGTTEQAPLPAGVTTRDSGLRAILDLTTPEQQTALWDAGREALLASVGSFSSARGAGRRR